MTRAQLLSLLGRYQSLDEQDRANSDSIIRFVCRHSNCCERSLAEGHITGSAWLVDHEEKRVLLTHHRKLDKWLQLGGHADGSFDVRAVALREAYEESGIEGIELLGADIFDVDVHTIPLRGTEPEHLHYDIRFAMRAPAGAQFKVSSESNALAWQEIATLEKITSEESMLRMARKWQGLKERLSEYSKCQNNEAK